MNICLVNPTPEKIVELAGTDTPHIGLGYLAAYLREKLDNIQLSVIDGKYENLARGELLDKIAEIRPDFLGITSFTQEIYDAACIARTMKGMTNDLVTCIGGVHATGVEEQVLQEFDEFDYAVLGEGEIILYDLLLKLLQSKAPEDVNGLIYRDHQGSIIKNPPAELVSDLDSLPVPDWSFAPGAKFFPVMTARGCPFKCVFCMRPYGDKPRMRAPQKVVDEIEFIQKTYQNNQFIFYDESLGAKKGDFREVLDCIIDRNLEIRWVGHTHVNLVDAELFEKMKDAGCHAIGFGVESGDEGILKNIGKSITREKAHNAVKLAKQAGLSTSAYFILGLPDESYKTALRTIQFARKLNTDVISIGIMIPFPKTRISEMVYRGEGGYKPPGRKLRWDEFNKQNRNPLRYRNINWRILRLIQISGYLYHSIFNLRFGAFIKRVINQRSQMIQIIKNFFKLRSF